MANKTYGQTKPYQQRHLITVEMDSLSAELYAPTKLRKLQEECPGALAKSGPVLEEHYVVTTRRRDLEWEFTVSINGEEWRIPPEVVDRIIRDRELIIRAQRKDRGKEQAEARKVQVRDDWEKVPLDQDPVFWDMNGQKRSPWDEPSYLRPASHEVEQKLRSGIRRLGMKIHITDDALDAFEDQVLYSMAKEDIFDPECFTDDKLVALSRATNWVTNLNTSSRSDNVQMMTSVVILALERAVFQAHPYFDDVQRLCCMNIGST